MDLCRCSAHSGQSKSLQVRQRDVASIVSFMQNESILSCILYRLMTETKFKATNHTNGLH